MIVDDSPRESVDPRSGVQGRLLLRARQRPGDLAAALLTEDEAQLLRRAQAVGWSGRNVGQGASQLSAHSMLRLK